MIELIIVRHGQSIADIENRHEGKADFPLTDLGRKQAKNVSKFLKERYIFDEIYSSPLKRASETAEIIGKGFNQNIVYDDNLREWDNGVIAGLLRKEANILYPEPKGGRKYFQKIEEGESLLDLRCRAEYFLANLLEYLQKEDKDKRVCIVSHGKMISMLYRSFLGLPLDCDIWLDTGDTGVHIWRIVNNKKIIVYCD